MDPETKKLIEDITSQEGRYMGPYSDDFSIYYYNSVAEEIENKSNNLGTISLDDLVRKNSLITKIGSVKLGNNDAIDVIWGGASLYYVILVVHNNHLFKIFFANVPDKSELTETHKQILSTFKFID